MCCNSHCISEITLLCKEEDAVLSQAKGGVPTLLGFSEWIPIPWGGDAMLTLVSPMWMPHWVRIRVLLKDQEKVKTAKVCCIWDWTRVKEKWKVSDLSSSVTDTVWPVHISVPLFNLPIMTVVLHLQRLWIMCLLNNTRCYAWCLPRQIHKQVFVNSCSAPCFQKEKGERSRLSLW